MDRIGNTNKAERVVVENPVQRYHLLLSNKREDDITKEYRETVFTEGTSTEFRLFQWWATVLTLLCNFIYIVYEQFLYTWFQAHHILSRTTHLYASSCETYNSTEIWFELI